MSKYANSRVRTRKYSQFDYQYYDRHPDVSAWQSFWNAAGDRWSKRLGAPHEWDKEEDKWYTSIVKGINHFLNPNHQWYDYDSWNGETTVVDDWINSVTGHGLTTAERQANELQMQNAQDLYQRQAAGMASAGLNPALMYGNGAGSGSAPSLNHSNTPANLGDLMDVFLLKSQKRLLEAQARNVDSQTDKNAVETENMQLINQYYPQVTETQISKILSDMGLNDSLVLRNVSEVELNTLDADLKELDKIIRQAEADTSSDYYRARVNLTEAQTDEARNHAAVELIDAGMKRIERDFMKEHHNKMGSNSLVALATAIAGMFGKSLSHEEVSSAFKEWMHSYGKPGGLVQKWIEDYISSEKGGSR